MAKSPKVKCPACKTLNDVEATRCRICTSLLPGRQFAPPTTEVIHPVPTSGPVSGPWDQVDGPYGPVPPGYAPPKKSSRWIVGVGVSIAIAVGVIAAIGFLAGTKVQEESWRPFTDPGDRWRIEMPGEPEKEVISEDVEGISFTMTTWLATVDSPGVGTVEAGVGLFYVPAEIRGADQYTVLEGGVQGVALEGDGEVLSADYGNGPYGPQVDFSGELEGQSIEGRMIYTGGIIYFIATVADEPHDALAHRFIDSFELITPPDASGEEDP